MHAQPSPRRPILLIVPHTHWDREWYLPFERFRLRLVRVVAELCDILDRDPTYRHFLLDGQTVALEDVLEVRPDLAKRIETHVRSGRLGIGPWYVLQDEFLIGGESIVRNLIEGRRGAGRFGATMRVGYLPDAFGHVAQMPRILQGFGLDAAVVWRGVGDRAPGLEWRWRAPAGAEVLCLWLPHGYANGAYLPGDPEKAAARVRAEIEAQRPLSRSGLTLLMNGVDHAPAQAEVPELARALSGRLEGVEVEHAGLERAFEILRERLEEEVPVVEGELRRTGRANLLPGVLSARSWQKRDHDRAEWLLAQVAEPLCTFAGAGGGARDRRAELRHGWRLLLRCQPHDSICGCSADVVHKEIDVRLGRVEQVARDLAAEAARALVGDRRPGWPLAGALAIFNPSPRGVTGAAEAQVCLPAKRRPFRLIGPEGEVAYDLEAERPLPLQTEAPPDLPVQHAASEVSLRVFAPDLPPGGLRVLRIEGGEPAARAEGLAPRGDGVENGLVSVYPTAAGLEIIDEESGTRVRHWLEDEGDRGDTYNFCPVEGESSDGTIPSPLRGEGQGGGDRAFESSVQIGRASATLSLKRRFLMPARLGADRRRREGETFLDLRLIARLLPHVRRVELSLELENRAEDHRLRAAFALGSRPAALFTDTPFGWLRRRPGALPAPGQSEVPVPTHPISSVGAVELEGASVAFGLLGLREVELTEEGIFYLTLLRSVGWLSRGDLASRPGPAGPPIETPRAQGIGSHRFECAVGFAAAGADVAETAAAIEPGRVRPHAIALGDAEPLDLPLLSVEPASVRLSAVKRAEADERLLVRLIGPESGIARARIELSRPVRRAWLSDLDERRGSELPLQGSAVSLDLPAGDVVTVAFEL